MRLGGGKGQNGGQTGCAHIEAVDSPALPAAPPIGQHPASRGPTHGLRVAVDGPGDHQTGQAAGKADQPVEQAGKQCPQTHHPATAETVSQVAVDGLPDGIAPQHGAADPTQPDLADAQLLLNPRNGKTKGLAAGVIEQVAEHGDPQNAPLSPTKPTILFWHVRPALPSGSLVHDDNYFVFRNWSGKLGDLADTWGAGRALNTSVPLGPDRLPQRWRLATLPTASTPGRGSSDRCLYRSGSPPAGE